MMVLGQRHLSFVPLSALTFESYPVCNLVFVHNLKQLFTKEQLHINHWTKVNPAGNLEKSWRQFYDMVPAFIELVGKYDPRETQAIRGQRLLHRMLDELDMVRKGHRIPPPHNVKVVKCIAM